jgi:hypothetical protein
MIELADTFPDVNVQPAEYARLLGYPRGRELSERAVELADWARCWYAKNGRPWVYARQAQSLEIAGDTIRIDGAPFTSKRLQATLSQAEAHCAILVAASAGPEVEQEAQRLWQEQKPDEYFFLEVFGSAVVEHLTTMTGARLCAWAEGHGMAVLPHYSPGYPEWDIGEQPRLLELMTKTRKQPLPCAMEVLESGALRPKKSLLAVFGLTHHAERLRRLTELVPCESCSFAPCQYRRAPYVRPLKSSEVETTTRVAALDREPAYAVNARALKRWAEERVSLERREDGTIEALFRYEGTTCANLGWPLAFHYRVRLGPREDGYPIIEEHCSPAPDDTGHTRMCQYLTSGEALIAAIGREKPLLGRPLNDVLSWQRPVCSTGCYCEPASREHKWGLVLETIHYALVQQENKR